MVSKLEPIFTSEDLGVINAACIANKTSEKIANMFDFDVELIKLYKEYR